MKGILFKPWKHKFIREHPDMEMQTRRVIKPQPFESSMGLEWECRKQFFLTEAVCLSRNQFLNVMVDYARYQVGEVVYIKELFCKECYGKDAIEDACVKEDLERHKQTCVLSKWRSPLFMPAWAARDFIKITDVGPERLHLPLSPKEMELEGGDEALEMLERIDGKWVWRYEFTPTQNTGEGGE